MGGRRSPTALKRVSRQAVLPQEDPPTRTCQQTSPDRKQVLGKRSHVRLSVVSCPIENHVKTQIVALGILPQAGNYLPAGRLRHFLNNWKLLTKDRWVLETVRGYCIEFVVEPYQNKQPHPPVYPLDQTQLISTELGELLQKGAIVEILNPQGGFYSVLFLVLKKDGGQRPVINLKALNQFVQAQHFKMEGIHSLKEILKPGDWLAKVDLKDAFFTIPIHVAHRKYLWFTLQGKVYEFNCLPFGLSSAPWVFTKTLKPVIALLRELGVRLIAYIDDILILAESREELERHVVALIYLLECMGYIINSKKSITNPAQTLEFLGLIVDTLSMELRLPLDKLKKIRAESRKLAREQTTSARSLARLLGKMNATTPVIPPAPLFCRHLQMSLTRALEEGSQSYETHVTLSPEGREELTWWDNHMSRWNGKSLVKTEIDIVIDSDASLMGWGATSSQQRTGGPWSAEESKMHINCLELLAATLAVKTFVKNLTQMSVLLRIDNTTAVAYINNMGGTVSPELVALARSLWMWCLERNIHTTAQYLPGVQNTIADAESRTIVDRFDWKLNPNLYRRIDHLFGPIEVDLFASRLKAQCPVYFSWRPDPYATATDAFLQDWSQGISFANPSWGLIGRLLSQAQAQNARLVLLAPVWKSQPWYPVLLGMLVDYPRLLPRDSQVMVNPDPSILTPQLAVWRISGIDTEAISFRSTPGEQRLTSLTTHSLGNGIAGVISKVLITFQDL